MKRYAILLCFSLIGACASPVPKGVQDAPRPQLSLTEARNGPAAIGTHVRWGGAIAKVENRKDETWLEIVERALDDDGEPRANAATRGRFLARVPGFLDPSEYAIGRLFTASGVLDESVSRNIGEFPYTFAVVKVQEHYLWPQPQTRRRRGAGAYPYYADPFWSPFWYDSWYPFGLYTHHPHYFSHH